MTDELGVDELRRAVVNDPSNAELRYLLGAEMAQQRDYNGAVMEMSAAVALNPLLHMARFQLGLLHLTMARPDHALTVLGPLENLDDTAALKFFKRGLEALANDNFTDCIANLRAGIELGDDSMPLNRDMNMLLERVVGATPAESQPEPQLQSPLQPQPTDSPEADQTKEPERIVRTDFSLYGSKNN